VGAGFVRVAAADALRTELAKKRELWKLLKRTIGEPLKVPTLALQTRSLMQLQARQYFQADVQRNAPLASVAMNMWRVPSIVDHHRRLPTLEVHANRRLLVDPPHPCGGL
jgi:hypothetical protein